MTDPRLIKGQFRFDVFNATPGAQDCWLCALDGESAGRYEARLREMWRTCPMTKQHLWLYARYEARGALRYEGDLADVAIKAVRGVQTMLAIGAGSNQGPSESERPKPAKSTKRKSAKARA